MEPLSAGWEDTVFQVEELLSAGRKVAILVIDMQEDFTYRFLAEEYTRIIPVQNKLVEYFYNRDGVFFVDVRFSGNGPTIEPLLTALRRNQTYSLFYKHWEDAFHVTAVETGPEAAKADDRIINKDLGNYLREKGVTDVVPIGCFDGDCVQKTASGALKEGFDVYYDRDLNVVVSTDAMAFSEASAEEVSQDAAVAWSLLEMKYPNLKRISKSKSDTACQN